MWYRLELEGIKSLVSKSMDKYTVRATRCMETSAFARHGRSVRKRFLQITRNRKSHKLELRGVIYNDSDREQLEVHTYGLENLISSMSSDPR